MRIVEPKDIEIKLNMSMLPLPVAKTMIDIANGDENEFPYALSLIIHTLNEFLKNNYEED